MRDICRAVSIGMVAFALILATLALADRIVHARASTGEDPWQLSLYPNPSCQQLSERLRPFQTGQGKQDLEVYWCFDVNNKPTSAQQFTACAYRIGKIISPIALPDAEHPLLTKLSSLQRQKHRHQSWLAAMAICTNIWMEQKVHLLNTGKPKCKQV